MVKHRRRVKLIIAATLFFLIAFIGQIGGAREPKTPDYYPLKEGWSWKYKVVYQRGGDKGPKLLEMTVVNLAPEKIGQQKATPRKFIREELEHTVYFIHQKDGVWGVGAKEKGKEAPKIYEPPFAVLKYPLEVGNSWQIEGKGIMVAITKKGETTTVPAGTFQNCLVVESTSTSKVLVEDVTWYAPGVGPVKQIRRAGGVLLETIELLSLKK